ncbi:HU family DNA-binding protein [Patescibacteria group bacterium]|jgi:nucleoid DNA-binding protein|nr:HU family DNA-binding protein [Patescibacteria group bacterium]
MTKTQLIVAIADKCGVSKRLAGDMVNCFIDSVVAGVKKNGEVRLQGFGTFRKSRRNARMGVNPRTGEKIQIKASNTVGFRAGAQFKEAVN